MHWNVGKISDLVLATNPIKIVYVFIFLLWIKITIQKTFCSAELYLVMYLLYHMYGGLTDSRLQYWISQGILDLFFRFFQICVTNYLYFHPPLKNPEYLVIWVKPPFVHVWPFHLACHLERTPGQVCKFCSPRLFTKNIGNYAWFEQNASSRELTRQTSTRMARPLPPAAEGVL